MHAERLDRVRAAMAEQGVEVLLLSVGPDLPWLIGYEAMPLERLTMLVVPGRRRRHARRATPRGAPGRRAARRLHDRPVGRDRRPDRPSSPPTAVRPCGWRSATGPGPGSSWTCRQRCPRRRSARPATSPRRCAPSRTTPRSLRSAGPAPPPTGSPLSCRPATSALVGRTEAEVSADIGRRLLDEGHQRVNFAIVAAGANAASPHHDAAERIIERGDVVLCDFGGTLVADGGAGYCSDITRCVHLGPPPAELAEAYAGAARGPGRGGGRRAGRHVVRGGRRRRPAHHHRGRLRRSLRAPHRPRHRRRGARGPLRRRRQHARSCSPATRSRSSRASTRPGAGASGSRTSSSPPTTAPTRSTASTTTSSCSTSDQPRADGGSGRAALQRHHRDGLRQDGQVGGERPVVDVVQVEAGVVLEGGARCARAPATCR